MSVKVLSNNNNNHSLHMRSHIEIVKATRIDVSEGRSWKKLKDKYIYLKQTIKACESRKGKPPQNYISFCLYWLYWHPK